MTCSARVRKAQGDGELCLQLAIMTAVAQVWPLLVKPCMPEAAVACDERRYIPEFPPIFRYRYHTARFSAAAQTAESFTDFFECQPRRLIENMADIEAICFTIRLCISPNQTKPNQTKNETLTPQDPQHSCLKICFTIRLCISSPKIIIPISPDIDGYRASLTLGDPKDLKPQIRSRSPWLGL
jgi:hypothetical protein